MAVFLRSKTFSPERGAHLTFPPRVGREVKGDRAQGEREEKTKNKQKAGERQRVMGRGRGCRKAQSHTPLVPAIGNEFKLRFSILLTGKQRLQKTPGR